ncbi:MAG: hypothetical protein Q9M43_05760 [Sulfurimonas sp.]|nr:hypothetical protein [Sulfurimonas sp.]
MKLEYKKSLPVAIKSNYEIFTIKIENVNVVVLHTNEQDLQSIKKHLSLFKEAFSLPLALSIANISNSTKKYLIENSLSFISNESIYLPQLLIYLKDINTKRKKRINKKLSKLAQTILIYSYTQQHFELDINESAAIFNVTKMSTSRALNELVAYELLTVCLYGRKHKYSLNSNIEIDNLMKLLKSPVQDRVFVKEKDLVYFEKKVKASYSALSVYANITNKKAIYALEKKQFEKILEHKNSISIYEKEYDNELIEIELWRYSPLQIQSEIVDKISLYLSLKNNVSIQDNRVMDAMSELYTDIKGILQ